MTWTKTKELFFRSINTGDTEQVASMLVEFPKLTEAYYIMDQTGFHLAAELNNLSMLSVFVDQGWDVDIADKNKVSTPLFYAAKEGSIEAARFLIDRGADVNFNLGVKATPLYEAASYGHLEMLQFLVSKGGELDASYRVNMDPENVLTPRLLAVWDGHEEVVEYIDSVLGVSDNEIDLKPGEEELSKEERDDIEQLVSAAQEIFKVTSSDPISTSNAVEEYKSNPIETEFNEDVFMALAALWAQSICETLAWEWVTVTIGEWAGIGICDVERKYCVLPFPYMERYLSEDKSQAEIVGPSGIYVMLAEQKTPVSSEKSYMILAD